LDESLSVARSWPCPRPGRFSILVVSARGYLILQLTGTLDVEVADTFCDCAEFAVAERPQRLVLEMSGLDPLDLVGVRCFGRVAGLAEHAGVRVAIESPDDETVHALHDAGLGDVLPVQ
jgi:anti-anti-sigma factor